MTGLYNIQPNGDASEHHFSIRDLPPVGEFRPECVGIAKLLRSVISGYLTDRRFPNHNDLLAEIFGRNSIGEFPSDRTMCLFVDDLAAFTPEFVRSLQTNVLAKYPLWRLLAQFSEKKIGIYPTGAWFGDQWVEGFFDAAHPAYRAWLNEATTYDETRFGPQRRQLQHVRALIPDARNTAQEHGVALLAVFDGYDSLFFPGHAVWFLQCKHPDDLSLVSDFAPHRTAAVSENGDIYPYYCEEFWPFTDLHPPFWLATYLVPPAGHHELVVKDSLGTIDVKFVVDEIVADAHLKAAEIR